DDYAASLFCVKKKCFVLEETGEKPSAGLDGFWGVTSLKTRRVGITRLINGEKRAGLPSCPAVNPW
ncbi:MAG: hypothetical protein DMG76_14050, partial [Acidobacteria bacterium]